MKFEKPKGMFEKVSDILAGAFRRNPENKKPEGMPNEVWKHVQYLKHEDFNVRKNTAYALGEIKHESAVPFLIQALKDENEYVRERAAEALGEIGHESAAPELIQTILKDKKQFVRGYAVEALGKIKHESAVKPLTQTILKDESQFVRNKAAEALDKNVDSLEEKQEQGKKLTPEGEKLLKATKLVKSHFGPSESREVKIQALHAALTGEINEENARLFIKQLRALEGNLK